MNEVQTWGLVAALAWPLVGAIWALVGHAGRSMRLGLVWVLPALLCAILMPEANERLAWLMLDARFGLDSTTRVFLALSAVVWGCATTYAGYTMPASLTLRRFAVCMMASMAGNFLLIGALDMLSFMAGFALMSYAGYGLIAHFMTVSAWRAGRVYMALTVGAELALWAGAVLAWSLANSWELEVVRQALVADTVAARVACGLIFAAFGVKAGLVPLHIWLPLAHPAAPTAASAVLSAAMIKAGVLGWLRFLPLGLVELPSIGLAAVVLGAAGTFGAVAVGLVQRKVKTILAYSSVSQMGYVALMVGLAARWPQVFPQVRLAILIFVVHHGLAKGALFLSVDATKRYLPKTRTGARVALAILVLLPAIAISGGPLTSGALAKYALKTVAHHEHVGLPEVLLDVWLVAGALATGALMARFLVVLARKLPETSLKPAPVPALIAWALLASGSIWAIGLAPLGVPSKWRGGFVEISSVWSALWPLVLVAALAWVLWARPVEVLRRAIGRVAPGDLLELLVWSAERMLRRAARWGALGRRHLERGLLSLRDRFDALALRAKSLPRSQRQTLSRWSSGEWLTLVVALVLALAIWRSVSI
ncbi:NADH/ubiquinone/plastoquinone (complex I) [Lujinxingia litoralis]|uniref:NADH/ubiquinone/plastoquinone (Complex I) n=1 Tax=Lujinxingia litoralis TaxID=2211119 RepID=A0A328CDZ0_9DELT|nr:complex I subunit 5 family protein [Lujinxingia litoralis]RAL25289.1 NADH/ubiquinone/plastoquinone (complex I) [Lujinxingia litoralis]